MPQTLKAREILARRAVIAPKPETVPLKAPRGTFELTRLIVAYFRETFGESVRLTYAKEAGQEIGERSQEGVCPVLPLKPLPPRRSKSPKPHR